MVFRHLKWDVLFQEVPEWLCLFTEVGNECCKVCHHTELSLQILFVLWNRHVLDVMNLGRVRSVAIFGVNVAEEDDLRLSDCALVRVKHQPCFFCSVHERFQVPVVLLFIFAMHADVICDPDHAWKVLQDLVHSGLEYVL